ncbi:hypothetical protein Misp01_22620 [Microtetraspora sp. NBRC 13810]|nr:hypothetical protein Misp01_22620 [Microtetraspora sp. NBRC 13810]
MEHLSVSSWRLPIGIVLIALSGQLDATVTGGLEEFVVQARQDPGDHLVFDLAELSFMDSAGLRVLLNAHAFARRHGGRVHLAAVQPMPARVLQLTHAGDHLAVQATVEEALKAAVAEVLPRGGTGEGRSTDATPA